MAHSGRAQRLLRCGKCRKFYRRDYANQPMSPVVGWNGYDFADDPPRIRYRFRGDGRNHQTRIKCRDCGHVWWTVDFGAVKRAHQRLTTVVEADSGTISA